MHLRQLTNLRMFVLLHVNGYCFWWAQSKFPGCPRIRMWTKAVEQALRNLVRPSDVSADNLVQVGPRVVEAAERAPYVRREASWNACGPNGAPVITGSCITDYFKHRTAISRSVHSKKPLGPSNLQNYFAHTAVRWCIIYSKHRSEKRRVHPAPAKPGFGQTEIEGPNLC